MGRYILLAIYLIWMGFAIKDGIRYYRDKEPFTGGISFSWLVIHLIALVWWSLNNF